MNSSTLLGDQIKIPIQDQKLILSQALVFGYIDSSKTEAHDFFQLANRGADVVLMDSGVVLQNLAIRSAINRMAKRPLLLWMKNEEDTTMNYILGESVEAGISGADGIIFKSSELQDLNNLSGMIEECHSYGMSAIVQACNEEDVKQIRFLKSLPDAVMTTDQVLFELDILHVKLKQAENYCGKVEEPTLFTQVDHLPRDDRNEEFAPLVKVCGIKTVEAAKVACEYGADMVGMIMVPGRSRTVDLNTAREISSFVRHYSREAHHERPHNIGAMSIAEANSHILRAKAQKRPMIVGVFRNQPLQDILSIQRNLQLDVVQLHGSEPLPWCRMIPCPVLRRFTPQTPEFDTCSVPGYHYACLLDSELGGEGKLVDWNSIKNQVALGARFILAGGLNSNNVQEALRTPGVYGVDVSGGVETNGEKDLKLIKEFVKLARQVRVKT